MTPFCPHRSSIALSRHSTSAEDALLAVAYDLDTEGAGRKVLGVAIMGQRARARPPQLFFA